MPHVAAALNDLKVGASEISRRTRIPIERVQAIIEGHSPDMAELRALSTGLRIPLHIFASTAFEREDKRNLGVLFRDARNSAESFDVTIEKVAVFVEAALELLPVREALPDWIDDFDLTQQTYHEADRLSKIFREKVCKVGSDAPLTNLPSLVGELDGVILARLNFSKYEGVSLIAGNYCFIFVSPRFQARMLFTLGHELGHVIAHHRTRNSAIFETPKVIGGFGKYSIEESFVDAFASCLLLPDIGLAKSLSAFRDYYDIEAQNITDYEICLLASFFGVSFQVAARRCEDLELMPVGMSHALTASISKQYGSPEKRAQLLGVPERNIIEFPPVSKILSDTITSALSSGDASIGWVSDRFGLSIGEILSMNSTMALS